MSDLHELQEEIFCIRYETRIFAGYVHDGKLERWIPGFTDYPTEDSHKKRYELACRYTENKSVLDIACGAGAGAFMLAGEGKAGFVLALDIDKDALRYASHRYKNDKIKFENGDASSFIKENAFDVIVSFETAEHLQDTAGYFANMNRSLKSDGLFWVSTPIADQYLDMHPRNPYHVREWGFEAFQEEVSKYMNIKEVYVQLYPYYNNSLLSRGLKKLKGTKTINRVQPHLSTIYKFSDLPGSVRKEHLGNKRKGYQVLLCSKRQETR